MANVFNFEVTTDDVMLRFSCPNHAKRIGEIVENLCIGGADETGIARKSCRFTSLDCKALFSFNGVAEEDTDIRHEAVFFENTEYPLIARARKGVEIAEMTLAINDHLRSGESSKSTIISDGGELYGSLNFKNQVGMTDIALHYRLKGEENPRELKFLTEVLSYKLDYRSDLKTIISDIEREYAMLSTSFLKDTYLSMRRHFGENNELIWWQIFKACYEEIIAAAKQIIDRPKRRLRAVARYDRAERLPMIPRELENEYQVHKDNPAYLYRTEEFVLSHDTIENRFLKYAIRDISRRFLVVKEHIMTAMHLGDPMRIDTGLEQMEEEMLRLSNHSFFRGVGQFKGFTQDNLVMKQAVGYKTIMEKWVELQQGYELEEGLRKLEVKDISELYEIWCFIKVKNIVQETLADLGKEATPKVKGRDVTADFIPQLVYGGSVNFVDSDEVELVAVSYNSQVEKAGQSQISGTNTITTIQRPDIVLRLSKKESGDMKYTYLFDAKYRIDDTRENGCDVPPEDAINQMHRYRDAIYYTEEGREREHLKKEIIAGYVLFPGRVSAETLANGDYYYQKSNELIGIGAFPLRPDGERHNADGSVTIDPNSSEQALRRQIREWLEAENLRENLLEQTIPQKGLEYSDEPVAKGSYFLSTIDAHVNADVPAVNGGTASVFYSGYTAILSGIDFQKVKYFAPVINHQVAGYFRVEKVSAVEMSAQLAKNKEALTAAGKKLTYKGFDKPFRISLTLGEYKALPKPFTYGLDSNAAKGVVLSRKEFQEYCNKE